MAVILNLVPVPPMDGFGVLAPFMPADLRRQVTTPPLSTVLFVVYFLILWQTPFAWEATVRAFVFVTKWFRFDRTSIESIWDCLQIALFGHAA